MIGVGRRGHERMLIGGGGGGGAREALPLLLLLLDVVSSLQQCFQAHPAADALLFRCDGGGGYSEPMLLLLLLCLSVFAIAQMMIVVTPRHRPASGRCGGRRRRDRSSRRQARTKPTANRQGQAGGLATLTFPQFSPLRYRSHCQPRRSDDGSTSVTCVKKVESLKNERFHAYRYK